MGVDMKALREKRKQVKARMSGDRWKPRDGKNRIRVVPWNLNGEELVDIEESVHFLGQGPPRLCTGEGCLFCQEAAELFGSDDKREKEQGKRMRATRQYNMQIVDRTEKDAPIKLQRWPAPSTAYVGVTGIIADEDEYGKVLDPKTGRDLIVEYDKAAAPANKYQVRAAASPSEIDLTDVKSAPFPMSVDDTKEGGGDEVRGNRRSQLEQTEPAAEDTGDKQAEAKKDDAPEDPTCIGEYEEGEDFCSRCEAASKCKRMKAHKA